MQKAKELVEELSSAFPAMEWKIDRSSKQEFILTEYAGGVLRLKADCERNLAFALQQAIIARHHLGEYLGLMQPRCSLRIAQCSEMSDSLCRSLVCMGFNALLCEGECRSASSYGLKVYGQHPGADALYAASAPRIEEHPDLTLAEIVIKEMKTQEENAGNRELIFYVPQNPLWLSNLCDEAGKRTVISFPSTLPFWQALRRELEISSTPLLPLLNEEEDFCRLRRHRFAGALCPALDEQSQWVAGQALWHGLSPRLSRETWDLVELYQK